MKQPKLYFILDKKKIIYPIDRITWDKLGRISTISNTNNNSFTLIFYNNGEDKFFNSAGNMEAFIIE